jgi:hypothetical protein
VEQIAIGKDSFMVQNAIDIDEAIDIDRELKLAIWKHFSTMWKRELARWKHLSPESPEYERQRLRVAATAQAVQTAYDRFDIHPIPIERKKKTHETTITSAAGENADTTTIAI